jgi:hypothetical protein
MAQKGRSRGLEDREKQIEWDHLPGFGSISTRVWIKVIHKELRLSAKTSAFTWR